MWTDARQDQIRQALNVFLRAGDSAAIDRHLATLRFAEVSGEEMLTYLRTLKPVERDLVNYATFFLRVKRELSSRGHLRGDTLKDLVPSTPGGVRTPADTDSLRQPLYR